MEKHIPLRMCVSCRQMIPQNELIRIVRNDDGISLDMNKKKFGRGAYICKNAECIKKAEKKNILSRHFKCAADKEIYEEARRAL